MHDERVEMFSLSSVANVLEEYTMTKTWILEILILFPT